MIEQDILERNLLIALLQKSNKELLAKVDRKLFDLPVNGQIAGILKNHYLRTGEPLTEATLYGYSDDPGFQGYLLQLMAEASTLPTTPSETQFLLDKVVDSYTGRALEKALSDLASQVGKVSNKELKTLFLERALDLETNNSDSGIKRGFVWSRAKKRYDRVSNLGDGLNNKDVIPFGIRALDDSLGGLYRRELLIYYGESGSGKSRMLITNAYNASRLGYNVLYVSCEMPEETLDLCFDSRDSLMDFFSIRSGKMSVDELKAYRIKLVEQARRRDSLYTVDIPQGASTALIASELELYKGKIGSYPDLICVDYVNLIQPRSRTGSRSEKLDEVTRELHEMARFYNASVVSATQESRTGALLLNQEDVKQAHIAGSHFISVHVETLIHIFQTEIDAVENKVRLKVDKGRYVPKNTIEVFCSWPLNYIGDRIITRVEDIQSE